MSHLKLVSNDTRVIPSNIEAEQALLGAILIDNSVLERVAAIVKPEHFFEALHARIFEVTLEMFESGRPANPVTVRSYLDEIDLGSISTAQYIARLAGQAATTSNAPEYARAVRDMAVRRQVISFAQQMMDRAYAASIQDTPAAILSDAETMLGEMATEGVETQAKSTGELAAESLARVQKTMKTGATVGLDCGISLVQELIGPMMPGDLIVLGGGTSHGKTALAQQMLFNVARQGNPVLIFSIEMEPEHFNERYLAQEAGVSSESIENAYLNMLEQDRVADAVVRLKDIPLHIVGIQDMTVPMMIAEARRVRRKHGLKAICIDHLQFIEPAQKFRSDQEAIAFNVRSCKRMAKSLGVPVVLLSHLNREYAKEDRRPTVSDLYGSGAIEKDADIVMFVHREERALAAKEPAPDARAFEDWWKRMRSAEGKAEVILGKRRRGKGFGKRVLNFDGRTTTFS